MATIFDGLRALTLLSVALRMLLAVVCGGVIGLERENKRRPAGFRTHILICLGACMTTLTGQYLSVYMHFYTDMGRLGAQVINGIGFLGAGTVIVTGRQEVKGLTTAAGLWASACMGLAVGAGFYSCVIPAFLLILLSIRTLPWLENLIVENTRNINIYVEFDSIDSMAGIISDIRSRHVRILDVEIERDSEKKQPGACFVLRMDKRMKHVDFLAALAENRAIRAIEEL